MPEEVKRKRGRPPKQKPIEQQNQIRNLQLYKIITMNLVVVLLQVL